MFKGVTRSAVYLILSIPLIVIAVLITKQVQYAFNLHKAFIDNGKFPADNVQQLMLTNELSTRSFFLIFICFLMILCGILIVLKGTENAFNTSKDSKVIYALKTAYPGLIMAIVGCLLLAYSIYKSSELQFNTTNQLIQLKNLVTQNNIPTQTNNILPEKDLKEDTPILDRVNKIPQYGIDASKSGKNNIIKTVAAKTTLPEKVQDDDEPLTNDDIKWANQLAIESIAYGYTPNKYDNNKYALIVKKLHTDITGKKINANLEWAYNLLQKTQKGYQPSAEELDKYEVVVTKSINGDINKDKFNSEIANY